MKQKHIYMAIGGLTIIAIGIFTWKMVKKRGLRMQTSQDEEEPIEAPVNNEIKTVQMTGPETNRVLFDM
jgi:hypothetical protein